MSPGQNNEKRKASGLGAEADIPPKAARTNDRAAKAAAQASAPQAPAAKAAEGSAIGETRQVSALKVAESATIGDTIDAPPNY